MRVAHDLVVPFLLPILDWDSLPMRKLDFGAKQMSASLLARFSTKLLAADSAQK